MALVVVCTEVASLLCVARGIDTSAGVRSIELAEELAQEFAEVLIIVDIGEELLVRIPIVCPVDTVEIDVIELLLYELVSMI